MKLSDVAIILVRPKNPGNVGSVARAMKNMGLRHLVLVDPCDVGDVETRKMAVGDTTIIDKAKKFDQLKEAIIPYRWTVATTRRQRRRFNLAIPPQEVAQKIIGFSDKTKVALVFGPEDQGLENAELALCQATSTVPTDSKLPSLNLAQAVMVYAYEIYLASLRTKVEEPDLSEELAGVEQLERMYEHFRQTLAEIEYFKRGKPERLMESIRNFLGRAALGPRDVRILRGILGAVQEKIRRATRV